MLWLTIIWFCTCCGISFQKLTEKILNWYEFSPQSLNVDSCLGLRWAESFHPQNKRLAKLVDACTHAVQQTEPKYWKQTAFVFGLKWQPVEKIGSRKLIRPGKKYTKTKFDEDFTDHCFSEIPSCRLSHICVRYIFAPPGRKYFVTHQLLLSIAYRMNCPHNTLFWSDLKMNEKVLCGSIHKEVWHRIELCDLRLEQVLLCGMAGFKGFLSEKWRQHLLDAIDVFQVEHHELACIKHRTARLPVYPFHRKAKKKKKKVVVHIISPERSVSRDGKNLERRQRHQRRSKHRKYQRRRKKFSKRRPARNTNAPSTRKSPTRRKRFPQKTKLSTRKRYQKRSSHVDKEASREKNPKKPDRVSHSSRKLSPKKSLYVEIWRKINRPQVMQKRKENPKSARELIRKIRNKQEKRDVQEKAASTLLDLSFMGRRRNLRSKTDNFGCDSHTTALLIANFLLMDEAP